MKPIASFDLESADIFAESGTLLYPANFKTDVRIWGPEKDIVTRDPGISVAAIATMEQIEFFESNEGEQRIARDGQVIRNLIDRLYELKETHAIVTWNGLKFDFQVLAQECGTDLKYRQMVEEIAESHCDLMYIIFCHKGYFVGLDQALQPLEISKIHEVTLEDGTILNDMYGGMAPILWAQGERKAVRSYLRGDVNSLYQLAAGVAGRGFLQWDSAKGKRMTIKTDLIPVSEARLLPEPDVSWMTNPPDRAEFDAWLREKEYVSATLL